MADPRDLLLHRAVVASRRCRASTPAGADRGRALGIVRALKAPTPTTAPTTVPQDEVDRVAQKVLEAQRQTSAGERTADKRRLWAQMEKLRQKVGLRPSWGAAVRPTMGWYGSIAVGYGAAWFAAFKIGEQIVSYDQLPPSPEAFGRPTYWTPYSKGELMLSN